MLDQPEQRKVTSFVTRGEPDRPELLVFWHPGSGIQIPAGTVEDGEPFEAAARREAAEETGLPDLELVRSLGSRTYQPADGCAWLGRTVFLQTRPGPDAPVTSWSLGRVAVEVHDRRDDFARIVYQESDLDAGAGEEPLVYARFEGWVPDSSLRWRQVREFYHFRAPGSTPERWRQQAEPEHTFELYWVPLHPKPTGLIEPNQRWLDEFHTDLALP